MAPESVKGVMATGWPIRPISIMPSIIGPSRRSGEEELTIVKRLGSRASRAGSMPRAIRTISRASRMRVRPSE